MHRRCDDEAIGLLELLDQLFGRCRRSRLRRVRGRLLRQCVVFVDAQQGAFTEQTLHHFGSRPAFQQVRNYFLGEPMAFRGAATGAAADMQDIHHPVFQVGSMREGDQSKNDMALIKEP